MTQNEFSLYTGISALFPNDEEAWERLVKNAKLRLASFLCLDEFPELTDENTDLAELLANFIAAIRKFAGNSDVASSKHVRNFTINFKSNAANAFQQIVSQYGDIIDKYSACGTGFRVERSARHCCGRF